MRPVTENVFTVDPPALLGGRCLECGEHHFPRLPGCPYCGAEPIEPVTLSTHGTLWGWTTVHTAPPGYHGVVPFGFGVVELPEGVRIVTRLSVPDDDWTFSQPMQLRVVPLHTDPDGEAVVTWEFAP